MIRWRSLVTQWLSPEENICPACGKPSGGRGAAPLPLLHPKARKALDTMCGRCRSRIPWIVASACPYCGRPERCGDCLRRTDRQAAASRSSVRYEGVIKDWLALYKYRGAERMEPCLAGITAFAFERMAGNMRAGRPSEAFDLITSVPLSEERLAERGFNQSERFAMRLAKWYGVPYRPLLRRVVHTEKQSMKSRGRRVRDLRAVFAADDLSPLLPVSGRPLRIALVDDIYTTGSTVNECASALRQAAGDHGAVNIYGVLLARS